MPTNFIDDRHNLYVGWVAGIAARHGVPLRPVLDDAGNYTDHLEVALPAEANVHVVVPYPPEDWTP